jgi:4-carboxymuconolactone decarboxylase
MVRPTGWTLIHSMVREAAMDEATRALVVLSAAIALRDPARLAGAIDAAAAAAAPADVEEALLQSYLFVGYPAALQAIAAWRERTGHGAPAPQPADRSAWIGRGEAVCRLVYDTAFERLQANIGALQPELAEWMIEEGYGKVLGRSGLELPTRELCIIGLLAAQPAPRQLYSHMRGALNVGAEAEHIEQALDAIAELLPLERSAAAYGVWSQVRQRAMRE